MNTSYAQSHTISWAHRCILILIIRIEKSLGVHMDPKILRELKYLLALPENIRIGTKNKLVSPGFCHFSNPGFEDFRTGGLSGFFLNLCTWIRVPRSKYLALVLLRSKSCTLFPLDAVQSWSPSCH